MSVIRQVRLTFDLCAESVVNFPEPKQLAQGVYDGLPDEWMDYQDDDDYKIIGVDGVDAEYVSIRGVERLKAELEQERKLTSHLEADIDNLREKNDNQRQSMIAMQAELITLQRKYDNSLIDWKACTEKNRTFLSERATEGAVNEEMVSKIMDAMEGAGFEVKGGWGSDTELEELETAS
ncbi:unnamed protein product, partial [marine sediment metagenome]